MKESLAAAVQAKNQTITRCGFTPYQAVFGRTPLFPDILDDETTGNLALRESLTMEGEVQRGAEMRAAARIALLRQDCQDKLKRALRRWPRQEEKIFSPGEMVYFYSPQPKASRFKRDGGAWRGPAVLLMREGHEKYYISWRGRCLLVAAPNLRSASALEAGDYRGRLEEMHDLQGSWKDEERQVEDVTHNPPPEEEEKLEVGWQPQEEVIVQKKGGLRKERAKEIARSLRGLRKVQKTIHKEKSHKERARFQEAIKKKKKEMHIEGDEEKEVSDDEGTLKKQEAEATNELNRQILEQIEKTLGPRSDEGFKKRLHDHLQDDVPMQFKYQKVDQERSVPGGLSEEELRQRFRPEILHYAMLNLSQPQVRANEWASRKEVTQMSQLLDLPITSIRYHTAPRKKLQKPPKRNGRRRITLIFGEETGTAMICQEEPWEVEARPNRKAPHSWRGATFFVREEEQKVVTKAGKVYVELPSGVYGVQVEDFEEWMRLRREEEDRQAWQEAFVLVNKQNGKELDPKFFDQAERKAFEEADGKEWKSWVENKVVRRLTEEELRTLDPKEVFKAPTRMIRVNKGMLSNSFVPKSRLVIPGHRDPHLGSFRSDAPTTSWTCVQLTKIICLTRKWTAAGFDVSTAFLSGKEVSRRVIIKAPAEGLPAVLDEGPIAPFELLLLCKSAYGLSEAPRLWYLRAKELLEELGFIELEMCRASFVQKDGKGEVISILCLHVDDGFMVTSPKNMPELQKKISSKFNIKAWENLKDGPVTFLGVKTRLENQTFVDDMSEYVDKISPAEVTTKPEEALDRTQLSSFRRLVMQLRWPAHLVMLEFLFQVSQLAQEMSRAKGKDLTAANKLLKAMKEAARKGEAKTVLFPVEGAPTFVTYFDASLGKAESRSAQQGELHFLTGSSVEIQPTKASVIELHSSKVHRIVRSSLAAESCALTAAADKLLFNRVLFGALFFGKTDVQPDWRETLQAAGILLTDAKALNDHIHKIGSMASEKQAALDLLMVKRMVEQGILRVRWLPTWKHLADPLTKHMATEMYRIFRGSNKLCLIETENDRVEEERRAGIRRGQRERRKQRMFSSRNTFFLGCEKFSCGI